MFTLLHGENINSSRNELNNIKEKNKTKEILILEGNKVNKTLLIESLETASLFDNQKLIILENLLSAKKKNDFSDILEKNLNREVVFWEGKEIGKTIINTLPKNTQVFLFKYPVIIFKFLESIYSGNSKQSLILFREVLRKEEVEMIFYLLVKQIRNLLLVNDSREEIHLNLAPWQINKLTTQLKYFTIEKLTSMYKELLQIDIKVKTGTSPFILQKQIELFIISNLA